MNTSEERTNRRRIRGDRYTVEEFAAKYNLDQEKAASLFARFGPSSVDLDLLMQAKRQTPDMPARLSE